MAETLNKRLQSKLDAESRENARRYWDNKTKAQGGAASLCEDCPPEGYCTDKTRCLPCPRRGLTDCGPDGGCGECDVCRYLDHLEHAAAVSTPGLHMTIETNKRIEAYLDRRYPNWRKT